MKSSSSLSVYIASSARNLHAVELLYRALRNRGHKALDWTRLAPPLPDSMPLEERRAALDADERGEIFRFCAETCGRADLVIYLGPAGQDAACEVGMAYVSGVPVIGLRGTLEAPGLILTRAVTCWVAGMRGLFEAVEALAEHGTLGLMRYERFPAYSRP
jgi:hypothetical protein